MQACYVSVMDIFLGFFHSNLWAQLLYFRMTFLMPFMSNVDVRVLSEAFLGLDEWDAAVQRLKVIIVLPQCSSSALNDPVPTIHSEHGGT